MATVMSTGQITLVDLTDSRPSSFYLQANNSKIQVYDSSTKNYVPNYEEAPHLIIKPFFFFGNEDYSNEIEESVLSYTINGRNYSEFNGVSRTGNELTIAKNIGDISNVKYIRIIATIEKNGITDEKTGLTNESIIQASIEIALVENGATGDGIEKVTVYYNSNNSNTIPPTSWQTDLSKVPSLSSTNKYLWSYQTTDYSIKDDVNTTPVIIGTYGDTGATGNSVDSITEQYLVSTSKESPIGVWSNTPPESLEASKFLWTRTEIKYKDATGSIVDTEYKPSENGVCDFTWNLAVDEVTKTNSSLTKLQNSYNELQRQIDGSIDTWYDDVPPTIESFPVTEWTTPEEKVRHSGDLYYNTLTGQAHRYIVTYTSETDEEGNTIYNIQEEEWVLVTDDAFAAALGQIQEIGAEVDGKMTIYYNNINDTSNPVPTSANEGDLWFQNKIVDGQLVSGDQYKCVQSYTSGVDTNNWTNYWELANESIGRVDIVFTTHDSSTTPPPTTAIWVTEAPEWSEEYYIWQKTRTYNRSGDILTESAPVCVTSAARSVVSVTNYYLNWNTNTGVTHSTPGWSSNSDSISSSINADTPYLWYYAETKYTYGDDTLTDPVVIGNYSEDGAAAFYPIVESTSKLTFSDADSNDIDLNAYLFRGGKLLKSGVTYTWSTIPSDVIDNFDNPTSSSITVKREYVTNVCTFICTMDYAGEEGGPYTDRISIDDKTDPIYCQIESSNGNQFTNGNIDTILTCRVFSNNGELTSDKISELTFTWEKYKADGTLDSSWTATLNEGKPYSIEITKDDISKKATFSCTVTK